MGRQNEVSLPYFELDCHMDNKIELIEAEYGLKGFAIVIKLYQRIYGGEHGYYCEFTPDIALLLAARLCGSSGGASGKVGTASGEGSLPGFPKNLITDVVAASIRRDIFSERLFKEYGILTSSGIQKQYLKATAKRQAVNLKKEYLLISVPENRVNVAINTISSGRNAISGGRNEQIRLEKSRLYKREFVCEEGTVQIQRFEEFMDGYPKSGNQHLAKVAYVNLVISGTVTEDKLVACAKNYAEFCQVKGTLERYIKNVQNFLKDMSFEAYLPENYKKPLPERSKNRFTDFPQRQYDYREMEAKLLKQKKEGSR